MEKGRMCIDKIIELDGCNRFSNIKKMKWRNKLRSNYYMDNTKALKEKIQWNILK